MTMQPDFNKLPAALVAPVQQWWQQFCEKLDDTQQLTAPLLESLPLVWASSEFVARHCLQHPELLFELQSSNDLLQSYDEQQLMQQLAQRLANISSEAELASQLRLFRRREMLRIVWRDIAGWAELPETTRDLSWLAEACLRQALFYLYGWHCRDFGTPCNAAGEAQSLLVLGMGKLGAWELNVSSDIDLIFVYPEEGETRDGPRSLSNGEFFTRLGRRLIAALNDQTAEGFVFRVDMRLRPFGDGGPLVSSFSGFENYYQVHGRSWERYAMVKARVVAGDGEAAEELMQMLRPFVYRRYLDYSAFESLREMKKLIEEQVKRKGMDNNVKLGAGGIREVEFIAQVFQLIRGGREPQLQERRLLLVLQWLAEKKLMPEYAVQELQQAYIFLRNTEHRIQEYQDRQTHLLPEDELARLRLAVSMGFADWPVFYAQLQKHRRRVHAHFEQVFVAPQTESTVVESSDQPRPLALWHNSLDQDTAVAQLQQLGFQQAATAYQQIQNLHNSRQYRALSQQGQQRMDQLMPLLLGAVAQADDVDVAFERIVALITQVARRSVYLALLVENPLVLSQLVKLCDVSPWIARYLQQHPILLDELMDPRSLYAPPTKPALQAELHARLEQVDRDDVERGMDILRHFKQANVLRVAAADIAEALPLMKVSDHLSWIAEVVLDEALEQAWYHLVSKHGRPVCHSGDQPCDKGFAVVAYGKLGGYELGYGSDLDLVFLHGADDESQETSGPAALVNSVFFARLGQRLIHLLTSLTPAGVLYEVDMRLRPDGASGMLVSNLNAFQDYQLNQAWLWEHQALVRARMVVGDPTIGEAFTRIRHEVLTQSRDPEELRRGVFDMRQRMRKELCKQKSGEFDLKQGPGGIVDIEFMVQYGVLAWAHQYPEIIEYTDNIRLLEGLARAGVMHQGDVELLSNAYRTYRVHLHHAALKEQPGIVPDTEYQALAQSVTTIWQQVFAQEIEQEQQQ